MGMRWARVSPGQTSPQRWNRIEAAPPEVLLLVAGVEVRDGIRNVRKQDRGLFEHRTGDDEEECHRGRQQPFHAEEPDAKQHHKKGDAVEHEGYKCGKPPDPRISALGADAQQVGEFLFVHSVLIKNHAQAI